MQEKVVNTKELQITTKDFNNEREKKMNGNLRTISVPFPPRLMSSSRTPTNMMSDFARDIRNMYASKSGAGAKRNGVSKFGEVISGEGILQLMHHIGASGEVQILAYTDVGSIHLQKEDGTWELKKSGLNISGKVRYTHFAGKLIVCNGVNPVMSWNGTEFTDVKEWVKDIATGLAFVNTTTFTIESDESLYAVGTPLKFDLNGTEVTSTVLSTSVAGDVLTVTISDAVLTSDLSDVSIEMKPPTFQYVYAAHDRLWGFGNGALKANAFSASVERTFVYYTFGVNAETAWRNESASLQYINLADKMSASDELVSMAVKDGLTVFFFKENTQVWAGYDPTLLGDFSWNKTIPVGAVHGDLVVEMPNDIAFFTRFGARTLSRLLQTEQLDVADLGSEVDNSISEAVKNMTVSDESFQKAHSFKHLRQGWFAFKPAGETFVFQVGSTFNGWTVFDGIFADSTAFLNAPNGELYLAKGGQLYVYDEEVFADDGDAIHTKWWTPWFKPSSSGKRWANKYTEIISEQDELVEVQLKRHKGYNSASYHQTSMDLLTSADHWDDAGWDEALWDNGAPTPQKVRDHFINEVFSYAIESQTTTGPFTVFGLKFYGIQEQ